MTQSNTIRYVPHQKNIKQDAIIYISGKTNGSDSVLDALEETGCEVVSTNSPTVGVALLYAIRSVAAVVLDSRATEQVIFDLARKLGQVRPHVPVVVLGADQIDNSPSWADRRVNRYKLALALQHLLNAVPAV